MSVGAHARHQLPSLATGVFEYAIAFETLALGSEPLRQRMKQRIHAPSDVDWELLLLHASEHADIRAGFRILPCSLVHFERDRMRLDGVQFGVGSVVGAQIEKASELAIFVASTGSGMEAWAKSTYVQSEPVLAEAAECLCDFALQSTLEWIERRITDTAKSAKLGTTNRFSPGYCTWPATDQKKLFSLLPAGFCGVMLTKEGVMSPRHSVSGVMGFGPEARRLSFHCRTCPIEDCQEPKFV